MNLLSEHHPIVQTLETINAPSWGSLTHLKIYTLDYQPLGWEQVWQAFAAVYPERWAIEFFPPTEALVNDAPIYHLWLLPEGGVPPDALNLANKYR